MIEKEFGRAAARRLRAFQNDRYFSARAANTNEVPLLEAETQPYIIYLEGQLALYLMRDYIGEDAVNTALRGVIEKHRAGVPPYPTALDDVAEPRLVTPDSLHYLITDLFETVTVWDLRTERATVEQTGTEYRVTMDVIAKKIRTNSAGKRIEVPMDDLIDIGAFATGESGSLGEPLYLQRHRIRSSMQRISITVQNEPALVGIDQHHMLIEYAVRDNVVTPSRRTP